MLFSINSRNSEEFKVLLDYMLGHISKEEFDSFMEKFLEEDDKLDD